MICKYGIDFGTTNSSIALWSEDRGGGKAIYAINPTAIAGQKSDWRSYVVPSTFIWSSRKNDVLVGYEAKAENQDSKLRGFKVHRFPNPKTELERAQDPEELYFTFPGGRIKCTELIEKMFKKLYEIAHLPENQRHALKPDGVVLGLPVKLAEDNHADKRKELLIHALYQAGFYKSIDEAREKTEFVPEPVAAAINAGNKFDKEKTVFVFDYGGGTLDIAALKLKKAAGRELIPHEVIDKDGDRNGGEFLTRSFFINAIAPAYGIDNIIDEFELDVDKSLKDTHKAEKAWLKLNGSGAGIDFIEAIDDFKCKLSFQSYDDIDEELEFSFSAETEDRYYDLWSEYFSRATFESAVQKEIGGIPELIRAFLGRNNLKPQHIDEVVLSMSHLFKNGQTFRLLKVQIII